MRFAKILALLTLLSLLAASAAPLGVSAKTSGLSSPTYNHIFVIVEENHEYNQIIGNSLAPTINKLAKTYGLATSYYGVSHPSEPNYVAMVGGNYFGIQDDNPYYTHTIHKPSIADQLEAANLTWKGYFQTMPYAGFKGVCYPNCNNSLYVSKHNGFLNFAHVQKNKQELLKLVPITQLDKDLQGNQVPNFGFIVPDECHDMHGISSCSDDNMNIGKADAYVSTLFNKITGSSMWSSGKNAIVIIWDEGNSNLGCCDSNPGGGHVAAIVITNNGPRGVKDSTPYNHYSLLATLEKEFGLGCLQYTCDSKNVKAMDPLFAAH